MNNRGPLCAGAQTHAIFMPMRKVLVISLALLLTAPCLAAEFPTFMTGSWKMQNPDGTTVEEFWTDARGDAMLGMSRTVKPTGKLGSYEFIRIAYHEGTLAYFAMPSGQAPAVFSLKTLTDSRVVFENPEHDFPKRIIYWRKDEKLCARAEGTFSGGTPGGGMMGGIRAEQWCWTRQ